MRHMCSWILALVLVLASSPARADQIDDFLRAQMKAQNIPGLSLAVVKDGKIVKAEGYGLADRKRNVAAKPETVYRIASVNGRRVVRHGGGMIGFRAVLARFVDDGLTIIVLMNLEDADREAIVDGVAAMYLSTGMPAR